MTEFSKSTELRNDISRVWNGINELVHQVVQRLKTSFGEQGTSDEVVGFQREWSKVSSDISQALSAEKQIGTFPPLLNRATIAGERIIALAHDGGLDVEILKQSFSNLVGECSAINELIDEEQYLSSKEKTARNPVALRLEAEITEMRMRLNAVSKGLAEAEATFESDLKPYQVKYQAGIDAFDAVKPELDKRISELDDLLRIQGKKVLAGRYELDAANEEKSANYFRRGALGVMASVIAIIGLSYYELANFGLSINEAVLRIVFSLILSVPGAYLARESSKHRQRQYWLRQTALEIGAIDSYIGPLPETERNRIKSEIALKLFNPKPQETFDKDAFPLNSQELMLKVIDVLSEQSKSQGKKDSKKPAE